MALVVVRHLVIENRKGEAIGSLPEWKRLAPTAGDDHWRERRAAGLRGQAAPRSRNPSRAAGRRLVRALTNRSEVLRNT
jgi:hypothetical protein